MQINLYKLLNTSKCGEYTHFLQIKTPPSTKRTPVHLIAVIDVSGSMEFEDKLVNVKKSLEAVLEFMTPSDLFSLIIFSRDSKIIVSKMKTTTENKYILNQTIRKIRPETSTNISSGLLSGFECQMETDETHKTSIILLTDGDANRGITTTNCILELIKYKCKPTTSIYTFGYGLDHKSELLSKIALENNGGYNVVNTLESVATSIGASFGSIACCVAQNILVSGERHISFYSGFPLSGGAVKVGDMTGESDTGILVKKCSSLDTINVKGYNIGDGFSEFSVDLKVAEAIIAPEDIERSAYITYMRVKLAEYIETPPSFETLNEFEKELEGNDNIIKIMREEIKRIRNGNKTDEKTHLDSQHATFYRNFRSEYMAPLPAPRVPQTRPTGDGTGNQTMIDDDNVGENEIDINFNVFSPAVREIRRDVLFRATHSEIDVDTDEDVSMNGNIPFDIIGTLKSIKTE